MPAAVCTRICNLASGLVLFTGATGSGKSTFLGAIAEANRWQLYRDPQREPDAVAVWRAESRWLAQHEDPAERANRFKERIVAVLPTLSGAPAERALDAYGLRSFARRWVRT